MDTPLLTSAQREFYEENGFLVVRRLVNRESLEEYREYFQKLCCGEVTVRITHTHTHTHTHTQSLLSLTNRVLVLL